MNNPQLLDRVRERIRVKLDAIRTGGSLHSPEYSVYSVPRQNTPNTADRPGYQSIPDVPGPETQPGGLDAESGEKCSPLSVP